MSDVDVKTEVEVAEEVVEKKENEEDVRMEATTTTFQEELKTLGLTDEVIAAAIDFGVEAREDLLELKEDELISFGMKPMKARKLLNKLKAENASGAGPVNPVAPVSTETPAATGNPIASAGNAPMLGIGAATVQQASLLPEIPTDEAWLESLKVGGTLKVGRDAYLAAVRATLASGTGVYKAPKKILEMMELFAKENGEQVSEDYHEMSRILNRRTHSDIVMALDANARLVNETRKKEVITAMRHEVWPQLGICYALLCNWNASYLQMNSNPMMMMQAFAGGPRMLQMPNADFLHDAGDVLRDKINRALAGLGVTVSTAMACDYMDVLNVLKDPALPAKLGLANREQMLKKLEINVDANLARTERSLAKFLTGFVELENQTPDVELNYLSELLMLGQSINWAGVGIEVPVGATANSAMMTGQNMAAQYDGGLKNLGGEYVHDVIRKSVENL